MRISEINKFIKQLDNNPNITRWKFQNDFIIWTRIRYQIFLILMETEYQKSTDTYSELEFPKIVSNSRIKNVLNKLSYQIKLWSEYPRWFPQKYDGICINSSMQYREEYKGKLMPKANLFFKKIPGFKILNVYNFDYKVSSDEYYKNFAFIDNLIVLAKLKSSFRKNCVLSDTDAINGLINQLVYEFESIQFKTDALQDVKSELFRYVKYHYILGDIFNSFLKRTNISFMVIEAGNYGGGNSSLFISTANNLGIKTIEVQHGVFDVAYNFGDGLVRNPNFKKQKTNILLTFGPYWKEVVNYPGKIYSLGSIFLSELKAKPLKKSEPPCVLFVSQGSHTSDLLKIALELSKRIKSEYSIIYKLHPKEYDNLYLYENKFKQISQIRFVSNIDIYALLKNSSYVVSSFSTLIFESIYFNITPFVFNDFFSEAYIPEDIGIRFSTIDELETLIRNKHQKQFDVLTYWEQNWKNRLKEIGNLENLW